jgi:hypothetical protein
MPVKITIKGDQGSDEYKDAIVLKEIFEINFKNNAASGEIIIISNATLFGQETKDVDLIVIGKFDGYDGYSINIKTKAKTEKKDDLKGLEPRILRIYDFCFVIETKRQRAQDIQLEDLTLFVKYKGKPHDVTRQSEKQKYALRDYFETRIGFAPYICNFIWLRNVSVDSILGLFDYNYEMLARNNYLPNTFNLKWLFQMACVQSPPYLKSSATPQKPEKVNFNSWSYNKKYDFNRTDEIFDFFKKAKQGMSNLTRKKLEQITSRALMKDQKYLHENRGKQLLAFKGRAGTGKTIKLLQTALVFAEEHKERCLILTYNHALASDIKRTLAFMEIPDDIDTYTVNVSTVHKFFYGLLRGFGIGTVEDNNKIIKDYLKKYDDLLKELYGYIEKGAINKEDLEKQIDWEYVLIDEAQDWNDIEKDLMYYIFKKTCVFFSTLYKSQSSTYFKPLNHLSCLRPF